MASRADPFIKVVQFIVRVYGEPVRFPKSGSVFNAQARILILPIASAYTLFIRSDVANWSPPFYQISLAGDYSHSLGEPVVGDAIEIQQGAAWVAYTIRNIQKPRVAGVIVKSVYTLANDLP